MFSCRPSRTTSVVPSEGLALAEAAEEDGLMADVVAMTGGAVGQDAIARLEVRRLHSSLEDSLRVVQRGGARLHSRLKCILVLKPSSCQHPCTIVEEPCIDLQGRKVLLFS
jgi:hypothetical protein